MKQEIENHIGDWIREFHDTMEDSRMYPGNDSGITPDGLKIIFDGFGYNEDTDEDDNENELSFALFVHKTSLCGTFPAHNVTPFGLIHRSDEEVCFYIWYNPVEDSISIIEPDDDGDFTVDMAYKILEDIIKKDA